MADSSERPGLLKRLARAIRPDSEATPGTPSTALVKSGPVQESPWVPVATEKKSGADLLPRYLAMRGFSPDFIPLDNRGHVIDILGETGLAFVAYWYCATRWRAQKLSEAPLMVVEEDQDTGAEEWLADHELADVLEDPSPDYDMGDLIERTSRYLDDGAGCLWVFDRDRAQRIARITPFRRGEYTILEREGRLYGAFEVRTKGGPLTYEADQCVYFRDTVEGSSWVEEGKSRLEVAMTWLRLGEKARQTVRDLLDNAVWPSLVVTTDPTWNPDKEMLELFKSELDEYAAPGNKGKAFAALGGGTAEVLSARIRDLVPTEVLDRVESVVAAVSGVPAIVLQFQVGLENSPWSQMEQARRMAYDDAIVPTWRKMERVITRQLLRIDDEDKTHFVRFDRSKIASLQVDQLEAATIASMWGRAASLNERREKMGLEPVPKKDDPEGTADDIPELTQPDPLAIMAGGGAGGGAGGDNADGSGDNAGDPKKPKGRRTQDEEKAKRRRRVRRSKVASLSLALRSEGIGGFQLQADRLLASDSSEVEAIIRREIAEPPTDAQKYLQKADRGRSRAITAILAYLKNTSEPAWMKATRPLVTMAAERATAVIAADVGINFNLLHPHVVEYARKEAAWLVKNITETTRDRIAAVIAEGLEAGKGSMAIARDVADSGAFARSRARLIARTESTRASSGGPTEALSAHAKATSRRYTKTWSGALDDRERDEHIAMEGETVEIDEKFSNGLDFPSEPNCRCALIYNEVEDEP